MVAPVEFAFDVTSTAVSVALPGMLWTGLFLLAWGHGPFAESIGLGRKAFWLLVPGALFASFAFLPITPVSYDWLAVSLAGAVFPLFVGGLGLGRYAPPLGRSLGTFLGALAVMSGILFVIVLPSTAGALAQVGSEVRLSAGGAEILLVAVVAAAFSVAVGAIALRSPDRSARAVAFLFAVVSAVLVMTFAGSSAIPGLGITESFPYYLLPPLAAGLIAGLVAPRVFPREEGFALPVAFFASTFGVLLGADLLREPPLYGQGPADSTPSAARACSTSSTFPGCSDSRAPTSSTASTVGAGGRLGRRCPRQSPPPWDTSPGRSDPAPRVTSRNPSG